MDISKSRGLINVLIAVLWLVCIVLGTTGHFVLGMVFGVVLMFLYMLLGSTQKGVISKKFLIYPLLSWAVLWIASFLLSGYFGSMFAGKTPDWSFLGLHPAFAPTVFLYWIGGQLTLNYGLWKMKDEWLSEEDWEEFKAEMKKLKGE